MPVRKKRSYLVDVLWPEHELHIISGTSGTWKTTLGFTIVRDWTEGKKIFGLYPSHPRDWAYLSYDRSLNDAWDTLDTIGWAPDEKRIHSARDEKRFAYDKNGMIKAMMNLLPRGGLFYVDGLQLISSERSDRGQFQAIGEFVRTVTFAAKNLDITILAGCHNAKSRKGEEYGHPRDRIMGSVAWGATTGTLLALENLHDTDSDKVMWVCPRIAAEYKCTVSRDAKNQIVVKTMDSDSKTGPLDVQSASEFDILVSKLKPGTLLKTSEILVWAADLGRSVSTAEKWLKRALADGMLIREGKGQYRVPYDQ